MLRRAIFLGVAYSFLHSFVLAQDGPPPTLPENPSDAEISDFLLQLREDVAPASQAVPPSLFLAAVGFNRDGTSIPQSVKDTIVRANRSYGQADAQDCDEAAYWIFLFLGEIGGARARSLADDGMGVLNDEEKEKFRKIMTEYDEHCLDKIPSSDDKIQNFGVLTHNGDPICSGRLFSRTAFLSAEHCRMFFSAEIHVEMFVESDGTSHPADILDMEEHSDLLIMRLQEENDSFLPKGGERFETSDFDQDTRDRRLDLPTYFRLLHHALEGDWRGAVRRSRTDEVDSCIAATFCDGLRFVHGCQSDTRSSGSTMLDRNTGQPLGRHLGTMSVSKCTGNQDAQGDDGTSAFANRGVNGWFDNERLP